MVAVAWWLVTILYSTELPPFGVTVRQALALDERIFTAIQTAPNGLAVALAVVFLAGLSEALGQSLILFLNRVSPRRFGLALFLSAGSHVVGYLVWATSIWLVGAYAFSQEQSFEILVRVVGLAYAPQLLSFFILTPYLGSFFSLLLSIWSLLATVVAIQIAVDLTLWQALICSGLGWLLVQAWRRTLGRPVLAAGHWLQRHAVGMAFTDEIKGMDMRLMARLRRWLTRGRSGSGGQTNSDGGEPHDG
jgi:hypothetical protein